MNLTFDKSVFDRAIATYGDNPQMSVRQEEMAELIQAISKHIRGVGDKSHTAEEIADVMIMTQQVMQILNISEEEVQQWINHKINRLKIRLDNN